MVATRIDAPRLEATGAPEAGRPIAIRVWSLRNVIRRRAIVPASWAAVLFACIAAARLHAFFWNHAGEIGFDDGDTMALGERLIDGKWLPYVDGFGHRGPLLAWAAGVAQAVTGRFGWLGARLLSIVTTYGALVGVFAVGAAARRPLAGAIGALFYAWWVLGVLGASPGYAITGEGVVSPLVVLSLLFTTLALLRANRARSRLLWLTLGGAFAAIAALAKQTALPMIGPLALWALTHLWSQRAPWRERLMALGALLAGWIGVLGAVVLLYAAHGQLHAFWYWYYTYNAEIYMAPYKHAHVFEAFMGYAKGQHWPIIALAVMASWSAVRPFVLARDGRPGAPGIIRGYAAAGLECTTMIMAVAFFAAGVAAQRFWPHYFLPVFPLAGLAVGMLVEQPFSPRNQGLKSAVAALLLLGVAATLVGFKLDEKLVQYRGEARRGGWVPQETEPICKVIDANSSPGDSLFVWGFSSDLYLTCHRRPASRYVTLTFVAGIVPPEWTNVRAERVAEHSREDLVSDLKRERPPVIIDAPSLVGNVSLTKVPIVRGYVRAHYCDRGPTQSVHAGSTTLWVRNDRLGCSRK